MVDESGAEVEDAEVVTAFNVPLVNEYVPNFNEATGVWESGGINTTVYDGTDNIYFFNQSTPNNYVTGINVAIVGDVYAGSLWQQWYFGILNVFLEYGYGAVGYTVQECMDAASNLTTWILDNAPTDSMLAMMFGLQYGWEYQNIFEGGAANQAGAGDAVSAVAVVNNQSLISVDALTDYYGNPTSITDDIFCISILGTYSFSDYVVVLGKWPLIKWAWEVSNPDWEADGLVFPGGDDVVLKIKQNKDGTLSGLDGGDFTLYFNGNLEFEKNLKLKVAGAEENEKARRIYFTDGKIL